MTCYTEQNDAKIRESRILHDKQLPERVWTEVIVTTARILNTVDTTLADSKFLYERRLKKVPVTDHLRIQNVYAHSKATAKKIL